MINSLLMTFSSTQIGTLSSLIVIELMHYNKFDCQSKIRVEMFSAIFIMHSNIPCILEKNIFQRFLVVAEKMTKARVDDRYRQRHTHASRKG